MGDKSAWSAGLAFESSDYLGVCLDDGHATGTVRLLCVGPEELVILVLVLDGCRVGRALHVGTECG